MARSITHINWSCIKRVRIVVIDNDKFDLTQLVNLLCFTANTTPTTYKSNFPLKTRILHTWKYSRQPTTYVVTLHVRRNADRLRRRWMRCRQEHMAQLAVLVDHLLHHMAGGHLDGHRNRRRAALRHHRHGGRTYVCKNKKRKDKSTLLGW